MTPLVSIIVPNYNHANFLERRLDSIFKQSYLNIEIILLDDCSSDNSREILSKYVNHPKVSQVVFNKENTGNTFIQWQKGLELAKGDFVWIAESDDYCEPNFIEDLIKPLIDDERVVLSYSQSTKVNEFNEVTGSWLDYTLDLNGNIFGEKFVMDGLMFVEKFLIYKNVIPNASAVIFRYNKRIFSEYITANNQLKYCGDWIFYFKVLLNNKVAFNPQSLNNFRYHNQSVIAKAIDGDSKIKLFDLDIAMRLHLNEFLRDKKENNSLKIQSINTRIIKDIKFNKALVLFENKRYYDLRGYFVIFLEGYIKRNNYLKRFKRKIINVLNIKYKA